MIDNKDLECVDRYCKTNNPDSSVLCRKCLSKIFMSMDREELLDVFYAIDILLYTPPKEKSLMNSMFGPGPIETLEETKERWFEFFNVLLLEHDGRNTKLT